MEIGSHDIGGHLAERTQVIENPKGPPLGCDNQITPFDGHVGDRRDGQVELKRLPARTVVERDIESELGAGKEQTPAFRVFANHKHEVIGWKTT